MNLAAIFHQPMSEYCFGLDETHIVYRLRCARGDVRRVTLSYGDTACRVTPIVFTAVEMELVAWDETHDYWEVVVDSPYNRVYYYLPSLAPMEAGYTTTGRIHPGTGGRALGILQAPLQPPR